MKDDGQEAKEVEERFSTTLAAVHCDTGVPLQLSLPSKGGNQDYAVSSLVSFMKRLGHMAVPIRSDGDPSITSLAQAVATKRLKQEPADDRGADAAVFVAEPRPVGASQRILQGQT